MQAKKSISIVVSVLFILAFMLAFAGHADTASAALEVNGQRDADQ